MLLAAGVGSRLRPYTDTVPKPMLDIGGWPILGYNLHLLADAGFDQVVINLHYLPNVIRGYVRDGERWGVRVRYSEEPTLLGTAGALIAVAREFREGTFAIVFGDNLAEIDLHQMLAVHRREEADVTMAVWRRTDVTNSGVAELDDDGRILRFLEKPSAGQTKSHWVNAGFIISQPSLFDDLDFEHPSDLGRDLLPRMIDRGRHIHAFPISGGLWWFDRTADFEAAVRDTRLQSFTANFRRGHAERSGES